jgi:CubicO group peptidase (beta-lactamase class C family)
LQICVIKDGEVVVDLIEGVVDPDSGVPVGPRTLFWAGSAAKAVTATVVHVLVERGLLDYDLPLATVWPEFAAHGKAGATVRHALLHMAGVPGLPAGTARQDLCDWNRMCTAIAAQQPWLVPGTAMGYHAHTYGFLLGEVVRRATGRTLPAALLELVSTPLGVPEGLLFGVPGRLLPHVARQVRLGTDDAPAPPPPGSPTARAMPIVPGPSFANSTDVLTADIPSQGCMTARAAATLYAALLGHVEGVPLVSAPRRAELAAIQFTGTDQVMGFPTSLAYGYSPDRPAVPSRRGSTFGMPGMNGCAAYGDIDTGVAVAVMRNRFDGGTSTAGIIDRIVADIWPAP